MELNRRVSTLDVSWFLDSYSNNQLNLEPTYQRRSVWSGKDRKFFLDTVFRGYPSPPIFLHKDVNKEGKTIYAVVDGKQRLETIINFTNGQISIDKGFGDSRLAGKKWKDIKSDSTLRDLLLDYVIPVEFINVVESTGFVNEVFERLNRNSRKLVEQELRHAKYDGWFMNFIDNETDEPSWVSMGIVTAARAKRMKDTQFLSELLIACIKSNVSGFDQNELDEFYAKYDDINDPEFDIDPEEVKQNFVLIRGFLAGIEESFGSITKYAKDFKNFYTLWVCVVQNKEHLPSVVDFNSKYALFMETVGAFKNAAKHPELLESSKNDPLVAAAHRYYQNNSGASTEYPQRNERNQALSGYVFG